MVAFDFDGTIVDSMSAFADVAAKVMPRHFDIDAETARRRYLETSGIPFFQQLEVIFPGHALNDRAAEEFEAEKLDGYFDEPLFDDVIETIVFLREHGIKTAVSSNNFQHLVDQFVAQAGIPFDLTLGFKPNFAKGADHFYHIQEALGVDRAAITFVGDSLKDGERASDFGIDFIGKEGTFSRTDFHAAFPQALIITHLAELKAHV